MKASSKAKNKAIGDGTDVIVNIFILHKVIEDTMQALTR
jgi:hypothetical protein